MEICGQFIRGQSELRVFHMYVADENGEVRFVVECRFFGAGNFGRPFLLLTRAARVFRLLFQSGRRTRGRTGTLREGRLVQRIKLFQKIGLLHRRFLLAESRGGREGKGGENAETLHGFSSLGRVSVVSGVALGLASLPAALLRL